MTTAEERAIGLAIVATGVGQVFQRVPELANFGVGLMTGGAVLNSGLTLHRSFTGQVQGSAILASLDTLSAVQVGAIASKFGIVGSLPEAAAVPQVLAVGLSFGGGILKRDGYL